MKTRAALGAILFFVLSCTSASSPPPPPSAAVTVPPPPTARVDEVREEVFGARISDPYRWMEKSSDELRTWIEAQDSRARVTLAELPHRDEIRRDIETADRGVTRVTVVRVTGGEAKPRIFLFKRAPEDQTPKLWVRDGWDGKDRLLVDAAARSTSDIHYSIDYANPSNDGRYVAYGISASGSEDSVVEIIDVDLMTVLPERIDRAQYAGIAWRPDNRSFFYWRRAVPLPGATRADWFKNSATHLHHLGGNPEQEPALFGPELKDLGIATESFSGIQVTPESDWLLAVATPGTTADLEYFIAPRADADSAGPIHWRRLSTNHDHVRGMDVHGDNVYALTYDKAPRYKIVRFDAKGGTLQEATDFVAASKSVVNDYALARDAVYVHSSDRGISRVTRIPWNGARQEIELPFAGAIYGFAGDAGRDGVVFTMTGWTQPNRSYICRPGDGVRDLGLVDPWPIDYSGLRVEEVETSSEDGTLVPMSIVSPRGLSRDGSNAALLDGYAAYGGSEGAYFAPINLVWARRGNVWAECHGRGSGIYGEEWHLAGSKLNKERGIEDMIACAEYLVRNRYTSPEHLAITGTSAGGILAGGAITRRPDLFAAALLRVPVVNLSRFETTEGGLGNVPEFGSSANEREFRAMLASDPYFRIKAGTRYPAMVVTGGLHDVRVPVWIPAKFVAKMQANTSGGPVLFRVEREAGHGIGSKRSQIRDEWADLFAFALWRSTTNLKR